MFTVYILYSVVTDRYYVGKTSDFDKALKRHNSGKNKFTKTGIPWKPVYKEKALAIEEAELREREIKQSESREELQFIIKSSANQLGTE